MSTLKSTLKLESTDLFPSPVSFTVINNNTVNGDYSSFSTITVGTIAQTLNVHAIDGTSETAYCYFSTPTSNAVPVFVAFGTTGDAFIKLAPGDVAFLPIGGDVTTDDLVAYTLVSTGSISYFIGNKD
jgi:hypothetical protein